MISTISFINVKGGVGKTTIAFVFLTHSRFSVDALLDLDLQENLTDKAIASPKVKQTVYDLVWDDVMPIDCMYDTVIKDVQIIPSEIEVVRVKKEMDPASNPEILFRLKDKLDTLKHMFDYILIDLHPDVDILTTMALMASTHYIIPVKPDTDSIKGLKITDEYASKLVRANKQLQELGILITDFDKRTSIASTFHESLLKMFGPCHGHYGGRNVAITTAAATRKTVFQYDHETRCAAFRSLAKEVIAKCEGKVETMAKKKLSDARFDLGEMFGTPESQDEAVTIRSNSIRKNKRTENIRSRYTYKSDYSTDSSGAALMTNTVWIMSRRSLIPIDPFGAVYLSPSLQTLI